jgi:hypothetical protein
MFRWFTCERMSISLPNSRAPLPLVVGDPAPLDRHGPPVLEVATVHGAVAALAEHVALVELAGRVL